MSDTKNPGPTPTPAPARWRLSALMWAPHRLGFFLAMTVLIAASLWWLLVQLDRAGAGPGLGVAVSPTVVHATVMVFGFMPLFFSGFLYTAGPIWLGVPKYTTRQLLPPLALQAVGWLLWLVGSGAGRVLALLGMIVALVGLTWMVLMFWRLIRLSEKPDQLHARTIGTGGIVGVVSLGAAAICLLMGQDGLELVWVRTALWGFIVVTFCSVAHRMIPFFARNVVVMWRPTWILVFLVAVAAFEVLAIWVDHFAPSATAWPAWSWVCIAVEVVSGCVLLWLAVRWGLIPSLRTPLLAMLHLGFIWFGLTLLYMALSQVLWLSSGQPVLGVGGLHALSMGFLGSLILAMVTRVTAGHSGRALVAGTLSWSLFWLLQATVVVRLIAAISGVALGWTTAAAVLWAVVMTVWGLRYIRWYGLPRVDGKSG